MSALSKYGRPAACVVLLLASACGSVAGKDDPASTTARVGGGTGQNGTPAKTVANMAVEKPGKLTAPLLSSDVLVYSQNTLDPSTIANIKKIKGIEAVEPISMAQFFVDEQEVTYAAVNPATFRRFSPPGTAQTEKVWDRVADGEIAVEPVIGKKLQHKDGFMRLGNEAAAHTIHIGAYAQILDPTKARRIDAVVNEKWVDKLGMRKDNAMLVAMDDTSPQSIRKQLKKYAGTKASVQILGPDFDLGTQTAFLTGGSVSKAVGSFNYRANPDGTVTPDPSWVAAKITTQVMPIIGPVTGNRVMLPQLRAALNEVVVDKLSSSIYHYDGCYVPRFIAHDPSKGLSFHTFGTAIDLNAADNGRGGAGKMDRRVVAIFEKWGFSWGGNWNYTDPMHFELAKLVQAR
ncbi:MAG: M15 family metallopeptidase [Marmoricola sp.]